MPDYFAHSTDRKDQSDWQLLRAHLAGVAKLAREFAEETRVAGLPDVAEAAGWLHDLGKYRPSFQAYIAGRPPRGSKNHKQAGAEWAHAAGDELLAVAILGHHGGLPDVDKIVEIEPGDGEEVLDAIRAIALGDVPELAKLAILPAILENADAELLGRALFSCLVDADWSDTRQHEVTWKKLPADARPPSLNAQDGLKRVLTFIETRAMANRARNPGLTETRCRILDAGLVAAELPRGVFTLTVPTGGGKTLSGLAFALKHAAVNGLRRVIYVAPYLSILEQNADVIRNALGSTDDPAIVFEHHSLAEPPGDVGEDETSRFAAARRAENWDAPVVITTSVQFFESLFARKPGACRKLHNIARSVILLDECQTLPPALVAPTCQMLKQLVDLLGCSIVLCTATQPAFDHETLNEHRLSAHEIIPSEMDLFRKLKRVEIAWPKTADARMTWPEVAERMISTPAALTVVNLRRKAAALFDELSKVADPDEVFHLSTAMCPAHRMAILDLVKQRLRNRQRCFVASTQLVEAGVDVDFPLVLREMAPLEAIIQAAGRCNREGLMAKHGQVEVFRAEDDKLPPDVSYRAGRDTVENVFLNAGRSPRIDDPADIREYFGRLFWSGNLDQHNICGLRAGGKYEDCAAKYRLIDDATVPVVVPTWESRAVKIGELIDAVRSRPTSANFRKLIPFQVNLRYYELAAFEHNLERDEGLNLVIWHGGYNETCGLNDQAAERLLMV